MSPKRPSEGGASAKADYTKYQKCPSQLDSYSFKIQCPLIKLVRLDKFPPDVVPVNVKNAFSLFQEGAMDIDALHAIYSQLLLPKHFETQRTFCFEKAELSMRPKLFSLFIALNMACEMASPLCTESSSEPEGSGLLVRDVRDLELPEGGSVEDEKAGLLVQQSGDPKDSAGSLNASDEPSFFCERGTPDFAILKKLKKALNRFSQDPAVVKVVFEHKCAMSIRSFVEKNLFQLSHYLLQAYTYNLVKESYKGIVFGLCGDLSEVAILIPDIKGRIFVDDKHEVSGEGISDTDAATFYEEALDVVQKAVTVVERLGTSKDREVVKALEPGYYEVGTIFYSQMVDFLPKTVCIEESSISTSGYRILQALVLTCVGEHAKTWTAGTVDGVVKEWENSIAKARSCLVRNAVADGKWKKKST